MDQHAHAGVYAVPNSPGIVQPRHRIRIRTGFLAVSVVLLALALRFWGIDFGLPYLYDQDERDFVLPALEVLATRDLNPHYFQHPASTTIYLLSFTYGVIFVVGRVLGIYDSPQSFEVALNQDPSLLFLSGRIEIALFGAASALLVYLIGRRLIHPYVGLLAAFITAVAPLHIWISHLIRTDIQMGFFVLVAFWFCCDIFESGRRRAYVLAGVFTALAVVTKYPAIVFTLTIIVAHMWSKGNSGGFRQFGKLVASGIATVSAAFLASPFLFLDWQETLRDVSIEARVQHLSATGEGFLNNLLWYVRFPLAENLSVPGLVIVLIGFAFYLRTRNKSVLLVFVFPVSLVVFISVLSLRQERWVVPAIPFLALLVAAGVYQLPFTAKGRGNGYGATVAVMAAVMVVVPLSYGAIVQGTAIAGPQTRTLARDWMLENIPPGSHVLVETYTPQLPKDYFEFYGVFGEHGGISRFDPNVTRGSTLRAGGVTGALTDTNELARNQIEYMVIGGFYERYREEADVYPDIVSMYEQLMQAGELVFEAQPPAHQPSSFPIRIYRFDPY